MAVAVTQAIEKGHPLVVEAGTGTGKTYAYLAPALRAKKKVIISTGSKALQDQLYSRDLPTVLVVEAGTGTGKTYAYLAPALRAKKKVIISTGSKALQDQLYSRDLPTVSKALKYTGNVALLKGRSNYLCLERLEQQALAGGDLPVQILSDVILLRSWSNQTIDGVALLKGRSNYLCLERLEQQALAGGDLPVQILSDVILLRSWSNQTIDGDISTCVSVAEDSQAWPLVTSTNDNCLGSDCPMYKDCFVVKARKQAMDADVVVVNHQPQAWPLVTSTNDNCLGSDCPMYKDCFVVKARKKAMDADVVVVNHHLFVADMVVKESGFGELIPEADVMIFDEAHQLPDIASQYFGQSLSSRLLLDLAKDITIDDRTELKDTQQLQKCADRLAQSAQDFRLQLGEPGYRGNLRELLANPQILQKCADRLAQSAQDFRLQLGEPGYRGNLRELLANPQIQRAFLLLDDTLELCYDVAKLSLGRSALLDAAFERATLYRTRLKRLKEINQPGYSYWYIAHG